MMDEDHMVARLVEAAEHGFQNDRAAQIRAVAGFAAQAPAGMFGVFLKALAALSENEDDNATHPH